MRGTCGIYVTLIRAKELRKIPRKLDRKRRKNILRESEDMVLREQLHFRGRK